MSTTTLVVVLAGRVTKTVSVVSTVVVVVTGERVDVTVELLGTLVVLVIVAGSAVRFPRAAACFSATASRVWILMPCSRGMPVGMMRQGPSGYRALDGVIQLAVATAVVVLWLTVHLVKIRMTSSVCVVVPPD